MALPILTVDVEDWFHVCGHRAYSDPRRPGRGARSGSTSGSNASSRSSTGSGSTRDVLRPRLDRAPEPGARQAHRGRRTRGRLSRRPPPARLRDDAGGVPRGRPEEPRLAAGHRREAGDIVPRGGVVDEERDEPGVRGPRRGGLHAGLFAHDRTARRRALESGSTRRRSKRPPVRFWRFRRSWARSSDSARCGAGACARASRARAVSSTAIERALASGVPPVLYAHPWEFDDAHPPMPGLSPVERLVHFAGRTRTEARWTRFLKRWTFAPISSVRPKRTKRDFCEREERREDS